MSPVTQVGGVEGDLLCDDVSPFHSRVWVRGGVSCKTKDSRTSWSTTLIPRVRDQYSPQDVPSSVPVFLIGSPSKNERVRETPSCHKRESRQKVHPWSLRTFTVTVSREWTPRKDDTRNRKTRGIFVTVVHFDTPIHSLLW